MSLEVAVGLIMIVVFVVTLFKNWLNPFSALIVCPLIAGLVYCALSGQSPTTALDWIYEGVFYAVDAEGEVSAGTSRSALMVLFACTYFTLMMQLGLFDPLVIAIIKMVKGDPLKIIVASTLAAAVIAMSGDGTSTVLITTAAFMPLYRQFGIRGSYLAILIALPTAIFNMFPWAGPMARCMSALDLEVSQLLPKLLPGMAAVMVYDVVLAYLIGRKERVRLGYSSANEKQIEAEKIQEMIQVVKENDAEFKRPKRAWYNLIVTLIIMYMLITGVANSALLFMVGIAAALFVNYGFSFKIQRKRLAAALVEGIPSASIIMASGFLMGVLNQSGMANGIAEFIGQSIPAGTANFLPLITAIAGIPGLIFLAPGPFYFGVMPLLASLAANYGISTETMGVAGMIPLVTFYATPLIAWLYLLCDRCDVGFGDYQKMYLKATIPAFGIFLAVSILIGAMPIF